MVRSVFFFVTLLPSLLLSGHPTPRTHSKVFYALDREIQSSRWDEAGRTVRSGLISGALAPAEIKMLAHAYSETPFAAAFAGAQAILRLSKETALTLATAFPITLFAETELANEISEGTFFWPNKYGRELQYDPETLSFYIHLGTHGVKPIGIGHEKVVTKTIRYDRLHPCVMARSLSKEDMQKEIQAMRDLKDSPGLIHAESLMKHKDPLSGETVRTIITKIFNKGSLQSVMDTPSVRLTLQEKLAIATDMVTGLASLHERTYVHRDLGARNYFVNIVHKGAGRRQVSAVIADLGRTIPVSEAMNVPVQGNKGYLAPEGFFRSRMRRSDYYGTDIFAVGTVLWHLYYGHKAPWQAHRYYRSASIPLEKRRKLILSSLTRARFGPLAHLREKARLHQHLTVADRVVQLIMQMTDPVPARRGTAQELMKKFLALRGPTG